MPIAVNLNSCTTAANIRRREATPGVAGNRLHSMFVAASQFAPPTIPICEYSCIMIETTKLDATLLTLTADIVAAHVTNNSVSVADLPKLIINVHAALRGVSSEPVVPVVTQEPAVSVRASIKPDYLVCLEDGKKMKMLKRHLMTHYQMTPAQYRSKWNLPSDYPMVAPNYAEQRRTLAKQIGLGRKRSASNSAPAVNVEKAPATRRPRAKVASASTEE